MAAGMKVAGLFAGIGGIELGLHRSGHQAVILNEILHNAQEVLRQHFPGVDLVPDVHDVGDLPAVVDLVAAGFPCQNLSQAGMVAGISGSQSGLVNEVFRITRPRPPKWLLIENVQFMLQLGRGEAMRYITSQLEDMSMRWAYRVVDSRSAGVPQRRRRVIMLASPTEDPREVIFADDAGDRDADYRDDAFGFYWTEGLRGLGWAKDAVPTLKGGSTIGIPSPPALWIPDAPVGRKIVVPTVEDGEELQGFERGWTAVVDGLRSTGARWKLVGNAVTVGVAEWVGERVLRPDTPLGESVPLARSGSWPSAAWGEAGKAWEVRGLSEFPVHRPYRHLLDTVRSDDAAPLSYKAAAGFLSRTTKAKLRFNPEFIHDVARHVEFTRSHLDLADAG
jgi:DNA (cytosine-5)-methyltransferase 1